MRLPDMSEYARKYGKHDLDRLGLFVEMPYLPARGPKGKPSKSKEPDWDERRMLAGGHKIKDGTMAAYFDDEFKRIFRGEGPGKTRSKKKKVFKDTIPFIPTGPSKKHSCPGDYFGTFGGFIKEFSPKKRKVPKYKPQPPNAVTNPGKKGGPGYINITIGKYPDYKGGRPRKPPKPVKPRAGPLISVHFPQPYFLVNPYRDPKKDPPTKKMYIKPVEKVYVDKKLLGRPTFAPTGPAKWDGGCKAGTFSKYPEWKKDQYLSPWDKFKLLNLNSKPPLSGEFIPPSGYKNMFHYSALHHTDYSMNATNWKVYEPKYISRLVECVY